MGPGSRTEPRMVPRSHLGADARDSANGVGIADAHGDHTTLRVGNILAMRASRRLRRRSRSEVTRQIPATRYQAASYARV